MNRYLQTYFNFIKKFLSKPALKSVIGLDIGLSSCQAVELVPRGKDFEVSRFALEMLDPANPGEGLKRLASALDLAKTSRPVVTAVFGKGTLVRYMELPRMTLVELKRSFALEADKYFPFPKDTIYTDCFILDPFGSDKKMAVLVAAVKKDIVDARLKLLKESGFDVEAVTLNSLAVANVFASCAPQPSKEGDNKEPVASTVALVDIGETVTNLMVLAEGVPRFMRDILIGTEEIVKRVANIAAVPSAEARTLVMSPEAKKDNVRSALETVAASIVSEIRLSFDYFTTEKNMNIGALYLTGDALLVPGFREAFTEGFDLPVTVWDPFARIPLAASVDKGGLTRQAPQLVTALGLALNEYDQT